MLPKYVGLTPKILNYYTFNSKGGEIMQVNLDDVEYITETSLTIRGSRRRTTVPKVIVEKLRLKDGDRIRWILFKDGKVMVMKVKRD